MRHILPLLLAASALVSAQVPSPGGEPALRAVLTVPDAESVAHALESLGYDVLHGAHGTTLEVCLSAAEESALRAAGFDPLVVEIAQPLTEKFPTPEGSVPAGYLDLSAIESALFSFAANYPNIARVVDVTALTGVGVTSDGHHLYALEISDNVGVDEDEPNILVASCHHAREIVTPHLALDIAQRLLSGYGSDPILTQVVDANEIFIAPVWNPDGYAYVFTTNNMWRKNRAPVANGQFGVDQNRNYPLGWSGSCSGSTQSASDVYRGPSAGSEIETRTMMEWSRSRRFAKVLDFHSSGREVLQSYLCTSMPSSIESFIDAEAVVLSGLAQYGVRQPSAEGEHQQWQMSESTSFAFLVETQTTFQPAITGAQSEADRVWPLVLGYLTREIPLRGRVRDATTGQGLEADLTISEVPWTAGETRTSRVGTGRYHLFLPPGTYHVTATAPGYGPETTIVTVGATGTVTADLALSPAAQPFVLDITVATELSISFAGIPSGTSEGYLLPSLNTLAPQGSGPLIGLWPDSVTLNVLTTPSAPGDLAHWVWPVLAPTFPAEPFVVSVASLGLPAGLAIDAMGVALAPGFSVLAVTSVVRFTL